MRARLGNGGRAGLRTGNGHQRNDVRDAGAGVALRRNLCAPQLDRAASPSLALLSRSRLYLGDPRIVDRVYPGQRLARIRFRADGALPSVAAACDRALPAPLILASSSLPLHYRTTLLV